MSARVQVWKADGGQPVAEKVVKRGSESSVLPEAKPVFPEGFDACLLTEAVDRSVDKMAVLPGEANIMRHLMISDVSGPISSSFHLSRMSKSRKVTNVAQPEIHIRYKLSDTAAATLNSYAKEFRLRYGRERHDHAAAAAMRKIDHRIIASRLPVGGAISDIGGNPLHYIRSGNDHVHVCGPLLDRKDQMRHKLRMAAAKQLVRGKDPQVADLAARFVAGDAEFTCDKLAQECEHPADVLTSIHVYDIPLQDWPTIMEKKGAAVVEGCMLHSPNVFFQPNGEFEACGARYEVDVKKGMFRMGFVGSSSWWYEHNLADYLAYGVDQQMYTEHHQYSYKIVERRGDTIFYRIIRIALPDVVGGKRVNRLKLPGAPMVRVDGMDLDATNACSGLTRKTYWFPRNLWYELVAQASEDYERGALDYHRMYNHYRTMSVRSTINSITVMGGESVDADMLRPLVVHACLAATASGILGQRETRALTEMAVKTRVMSSEGTFKKLLGAMETVVMTATGKILAPIAAFRRALDTRAFDAIAAWLLEWQPDTAHVDVDVTPIFVKAYGPGKGIPATAVLDKLAARAAPMAVFEQSTSPRLEKLRRSMLGLEPLDEPSEDAASRDQVVETVEGSTSNGLEVGSVEHDLRVAAISEHIEEIEAENRAYNENCCKAYSKLVVNGKPSKAQLQKYNEIFSNPDLWHVSNGVIDKSLLGHEPSAFQHSAVYHPDFQDSEGTNFLRVRHDKYQGPDSSGEYVERDYWLLEGHRERFTGWVLVTDELIIFNGPEILESLRSALKLRHDYTVHLERGPPGCGKTYSILQQFKPGEDAIMCPVRESVVDTRKRAEAMHPNHRDLRSVIRTLDSYLTNYRDPRVAEVRADRLLADECFMAHSGKIYACAAMLGVTSIRAYGDDNQIPHIPRVRARKTFVKIRSQGLSEVWTTRRCPHTAVAAWGAVYDWRVRSLSDQIGEMKMVHDTSGLQVPDGCVMMCMYQADKLVLKKRYAPYLSRITILTAHEAEGKTYKHVWLHRFDARRRTDKSNLFDQSPHVLVAMSRHTHSFVYYCPTDLNDLVSQLIKGSKNPRRVCAAADTSTAGQSIQFI